MTENMTADGPSLLETGFHPRTSALTDHFVEYAGFWLPSRFSDDDLGEYWACRQGVTMMDLSPLRKFEILGPDAQSLLQHCLPRNVRRVSVGQVIYAPLCNDLGGIIDDGTLFRLGPDNFRWVGASDFDGEWLKTQAEALGLRAHVRPSTHLLHNLAVQGPKSRDLLKGIVWTAPVQPTLDELRWYRFAVARLNDFDGIPIIVSRTGYSGELGFEIWCHPKHATTVWDTVWDAGQSHQVMPMGLDALDRLRVEAGLVFAGYEYDDQTDPFEAGIGAFIPSPPKDDDYVGKSALAQRRASPTTQLVGLTFAPENTPAGGDGVQYEGKVIGQITSATYSPILDQSIALAKVATGHKPGEAVTVGANELAGKIVSLPFYDPGKTRIKG